MDDAKHKVSTEWVTFAVMIVGTISIVASEYKITGTMPQIIADWGISVSSAGLLMTIPALSALCIALPGGAIARKAGTRNVLLATLVCDLIANVLGGLATDFAMLAAMRLIDGMSVGLSIVVVPSIIAQIFPAEKRGLPMTLWGLRTALGTLIILNVCNAITPLYGWQANWWVSALFIGIALVLVYKFVKIPAGSPSTQDDSSAAGGGRMAWPGMFSCLKSISAWCICLANFTAFFGFSAYVTYYPTYLTMYVGLPAAEANSITTLHTYLMVIICLTFGFVLNRVPNRKHPRILILALVMGLVGNLLLWATPSVLLDVLGILFCAGGFQLAAPLNHNLMPEVVGRDVVPIGMGMIAVFTSLAAIGSTLVCGRIVDMSGGNWALLAIPTGMVAAIGLAASIILAVRVSKAAEDDKS